MRTLGPGARIGPSLEVIAHLHRSRALDVYDAWSDERGCRCTVKTPRPDRLRDSNTVRALRREGRLLAGMAHPHVVRAYEVLAEPRPAIVLETLGGQTLAHLIEDGARPLTNAELGHLGMQVGSALRYLHARGVLHLDIKPSNAIVEAGRVKLIDLSLARPPGRMRAGRGTWCYMAPEQARGGDVGAAADVWGLGALLHEAAAGAPAFGGEEDDDVDYPQLVRRAAPVRRRRLDRALRETIAACLEPEAAARPPLADVLRVCERAAGLPAAEQRLSRAAYGLVSSSSR